MPEFRNPLHVSVTERGAAVRWQVAVAVLAAAYLGGTGLAVHPHVHLPWRWLAVGGALGCSAVAAWCGRQFARWEQRRQPRQVRQVTRWRSGERMRHE